MSAVLVDSNVLLDMFTEDPRWLSRSSAALERAANGARIVINPIIYSEVSTRFERIEKLEEALPPAISKREPIP